MKLKSIRATPPPIPSTWRLAWGKINQLTGSTWRDQQIAIFPSHSSPHTSPQVISPGEQFVIVGDIWLSNRQQLLRLQNLDDNYPLSDLQLVARVWENWGVKTFTKLIL